MPTTCTPSSEKSLSATSKRRRRGPGSDPGDRSPGRTWFVFAVVLFRIRYQDSQMDLSTGRHGGPQRHRQICWYTLVGQAASITPRAQDRASP